MNLEENILGTTPFEINEVTTKDVIENNVHVKRSAVNFISLFALICNILGCQISSFRFFALYSMLYKKCYSDRI